MRKVFLISFLSVFITTIATTAFEDSNTNDIKLILYSKSQFGSPVDLSTRIANSFPVVVNLESDPTVVSVIKYIPSR